MAPVRDGNKIATHYPSGLRSGLQGPSTKMKGESNGRFQIQNRGFCKAEIA